MSSNISRITPETPEALQAFRQLALAPNDEKPIVEMTEETSRDLETIWTSVAATARRWRGEQEVHFPGMPTDRKEFWGAFSKDHPPRSLPVMEEFIAKTPGNGKIAVDLGCGNSPAVRSLLQKGWKVIAVDYSPSSLDTLVAKNTKEIESGQLQVVETDVSAFAVSEPVDLILAADILPYIDPGKFRFTWEKIHNFIKEGGFFVGTLFRSAVKDEQIPQMNLMKEMGAWFLPDRRMVRALLTKTGYEVQTCRYRIDDPNEQDPMCIQFIAKKNTQVAAESV